MKSVYNFVVKPKGKRYNNTKKVGDSELILNTEIFNHQYVNREAIVISTPIVGDTDIKPGDTVIVHHNVFRRWHNIKGVEKNSRAYFNESTYLINNDQIFLYKRNKEWIAPKGYCFVNPIKNKDKYNVSKEKPLTGVLKYLSQEIRDFGLKENDVVGFTPNSEYEFIIDNQRLYRVPTNSISIKYGHKKDEAEYNPEWL